MVSSVKPKEKLAPMAWERFVVCLNLRCLNREAYELATSEGNRPYLDCLIKAYRNKEIGREFPVASHAARNNLERCWHNDTLFAVPYRCGKRRS